MRILHLHCKKDETMPDGEAGEIAAAAGVPIEAFLSRRPFEAPIETRLLDDVSGVIIGGSDWSVTEDIPHFAAFRDILQEARRRALPVFGICFGAQALAQIFGGRVERAPERAEYGSIEVWREALEHPLFAEMPGRFRAQAWHQDRIVDLPAGAMPLAWSQDDVMQAFAFCDAPIIGVQFHPERTHETFERLLETRAAPCETHPIEKIRASLAPSPEATALLARAVRGMVPQT